MTTANQDLNILRFMPKEYDDDWQQCFLEAIDGIPFAPYKTAGQKGQGVTEDMYWDEKLLMKADPEEPNSFCCGAVMEVLIRGLEKCPLYGLGVTHEMLRKLIPWAFVYEAKHRRGIAEGMVKLGMGDWVDDVTQARLGDLAQIEGIKFNGDYDDGHTVAILGTGVRNGKPVVWSFSSTTGVNPAGHAVDWHWMFKSRNGYSRKWHIARPKLSF